MRYIVAPSSAFLLVLLTVQRGPLAQEAIEVPPVEIEGERVAKEGASAEEGLLVEGDYLESPKGPGGEIKGLPGLIVREAGGSGQAVSVGLRGAEPAATLTTLEGIPLNSPFLGGADLSSLALHPIESLEIRPGGMASAFGTDAIGGILEARVPSPREAPSFRASLTVGSFGTARVKALQSGGLGRVYGLASLGMLASSSNFPFVDSNGQRRTRVHNGTSAIAGLGKVEVLLTDRDLLSVFAEVFSDDREVPGLEQFPSFTARQKDHRLIASVDYRGRGLTVEGLSEATLYLRHLVFAYKDPMPPMGPPVDTKLTADEVGLRAMVEERPLRLLQCFVGLDSRFTFGHVDRVSQAMKSPKRASVAGLSKVSVHPYEAITLSASVRAEWDQGSGLMLLPRGELRLIPQKYLEFFASASRSFRLPTFEELYFQAGYVQGNPKLKPEDAITLDGGVKASLGKANFRLCGFYNRIANIIVFLPSSAFLTRAENSGHSTMKGLEVTGRLEVVGVVFSLSYTFLDARLEDGRRMPARPKHLGAFGIEWGPGPVRLSLKATGQSSFFLDRYEARREEGRLILDGRVELALRPEVVLSFDGQNLLDKRDAVDSLQYPLPGRAFYGSLRVTL